MNKTVQISLFVINVIIIIAVIHLLMTINSLPPNVPYSRSMFDNYSLDQLDRYFQGKDLYAKGLLEIITGVGTLVKLCLIPPVLILMYLLKAKFSKQAN